MAAGMMLDLYNLESFWLQTPAFIPSANTKIVEVFNWYFLGSTYLGQGLLAFFMIYFLKFDPLFSTLLSLFWLAPPTINFVFLVSSGAFKVNFVQYHMMFMWFLTFIQGFFIIVAWNLLQGGFTSFFTVPVTLSSIFVALCEILNYVLQDGLFMTYVYMIRHDLHIPGII